jgi:hypothetical protein
MRPSNFMEFAGLKRKPLFMDPIKTLIQQLMDAANSGEDKRVLLALVEELRFTLNNAPIVAAVPDSVSVVMPNGFQASYQPVAETRPSIKPQFSVPRPPTVVLVEEEETAAKTQDTLFALPTEPKKTPEPTPIIESQVESPIIDLFDFSIEEKAIELPDEIEVETVAAVENTVEIEMPTPVPVKEIPGPVMNMELLLTPEMIAEAVALEMQALNPVEEPEWSEPQAIFRHEEAPKDLNDKMAQRSKMLNEVFVQKEPELVEVLAKPRIADLRKSISINEKYQFIGSLFRGDEDMFERSIKTLNNFTVLQEAQYWMQRELIIKLGWNDEDELVQRFFDLVSRRFN